MSLKQRKETNISNKRNIVKYPNWQEADQLKAWPRIWTRDYWETNPANGRVEDLNPGPLDYNASALKVEGARTVWKLGAPKAPKTGRVEI